ncbi:unnamed protein product [Merluccius merluccius]
MAFQDWRHVLKWTWPGPILRSLPKEIKGQDRLGSHGHLKKKKEKKKKRKRPSAIRLLLLPQAAPRRGGLSWTP